MSRIGKKPVPIPSGVTVSESGGVVSVKGPKGELTQGIDDFVSLSIEDGALSIVATGETRTHRARHGLYRSLIANMVEGCSNGFTKLLEINGVGYQAKVANNKLTLQIGYCHPVEMDMPDGVTIEAPSTTRLTISGADKQKVGQVAANIRRIRPPEPYKGKGIKYSDEIIRRKAGKSVAAG